MPAKSYENSPKKEFISSPNRVDAFVLLHFPAIDRQLNGPKLSFTVTVSATHGEIRTKISAVLVYTFRNN